MRIIRKAVVSVGSSNVHLFAMPAQNNRSTFHPFAVASSMKREMPAFSIFFGIPNVRQGAQSGNNFPPRGRDLSGRLLEGSR